MKSLQWKLGKFIYHRAGCFSFLSTERIGCRQQDGDDVATHARLFINEIPARKEFIYHILITIYSRRFLFLVMGRIKESDSTLHLFREVDRARD